MNTAGARPVPHHVTKIKPAPHGKTSTGTKVQHHWYGNGSDDDMPAGVAVAILLVIVVMIVGTLYLVGKR